MCREVKLLLLIFILYPEHPVFLGQTLWQLKFDTGMLMDKLRNGFDGKAHWVIQKYGLLVTFGWEHRHRWEHLGGILQQFVFVCVAIKLDNSNRWNALETISKVPHEAHIEVIFILIFIVGNVRDHDHILRLVPHDGLQGAPHSRHHSMLVSVLLWHRSRRPEAVRILFLLDRVHDSLDEIHAKVIRLDGAGGAVLLDRPSVGEKYLHHVPNLPDFEGIIDFRIIPRHRENELRVIPDRPTGLSCPLQERLILQQS
mmetsp:Transcript_15558/g.44243  ORF Transcript_15558/g.44243 Transcript_15558/m.44243 type:complete len:256 (-) Transcript_15558:1092-1859(-)